MSKFLKHLPCPQCGSRDNLGEYDDHFFCFGCKYHKHKNDVHSLRQRINPQTDEKGFEMIDKISDLPRNAMKWLLSYGISKEEIDEYGVKWSPKQQLLILLDTAKYWQGRSFAPNRPKYLSSGSKPLTIYGEADRIVIVEDIVSAWKIARLRKQYCAVPVLGSSLSYEMEQQLVDMNFKEVLVWLDRDKSLNALRIKRKFLQRGVDSRVIVTDNDPKEYSKGEIEEWLRSK